MELIEHAPQYITGIYELDLEIAIALDIVTLRSFLSLSRTSRELINDESLWKERAVQEMDSQMTESIYF